MKRKGIRILPATEHRVETGALQFDGDWPGLYIRGDDAMSLVGNINEIKAFLKAHKEDVTWEVVNAVMALDVIRKLIKDNVIQR